MTPKPNKAPGFEEAIAEVEVILAKLEAGDVPIDDLAVEVKRAVTLVDACRDKLRRTELEVQDVVSGLDRDDEDATDRGSE